MACVANVINTRQNVYAICMEGRKELDTLTATPPLSRSVIEIWNLSYNYWDLAEAIAVEYITEKLKEMGKLPLNHSQATDCEKVVGSIAGESSRYVQTLSGG